MPIAIKPLVPLALLAAALLGVGVAAHHLDQRHRQTLTTQWQASETARLAAVARHTHELAHAFLRAAASNAMLKQMSASEQVHALADSASPFALSVVSLHDRASNTLHLANAPSRAGEFYGFEPLIQASYASGKATSFVGEYRGKPALMYAEPMREGDSVTGLLLAARMLDQNLVDDWHRASGQALQLGVAGQSFAAGSGERSLVVPVAVDGGMPIRLELRLPDTEHADWSLLAFSVLLAGLGFGLGWHGLAQRQRSIAALTTAAAGANPNLAEALASDDELAPLARALSQNLATRIADQADAQARYQESVRVVEKLSADNRALAQARDEALRAPRTKSEFLSRMGDEVTTPMHSVVSMLDLLREYELPSEPRELLSIAHRSAHTLTENLNNIMDFSKLDAGLLKLHIEPFQVGRMVQDVVTQLRVHASDKGLRLDYNLAEGVPPTALGDPIRIQQILSNLVGNAIRFTKDGEVAVYVDILQPAEDRFLRFSVVDTGVGIPKDAQAGLFDSLDSRSRLNNASFAGRLRLIVAKELTALMGGQIGVSSEPGKGSRFWFTIKLAR